MASTTIPTIDSLGTENIPVPEISGVQPSETETNPMRGEKGAEKQPLPSTAPPLIKNTPPDPDPINAKPDPTKIVDLSAGKTTIHPVDPNADKLTTLADKEEEEFIEGVEAAHNEHK